MGRQDGQESWTQVGESDHHRRPSPTPAQGRPVVVGNIASVRVAPGSRDRRISPPPRWRESRPIFHSPHTSDCRQGLGALAMRTVPVPVTARQSSGVLAQSPIRLPTSLTATSVSSSAHSLCSLAQVGTEGACYAEAPRTDTRSRKNRAGLPQTVDQVKRRLALLPSDQPADHRRSLSRRQHSLHVLARTQ